MNLSSVNKKRKGFTLVELVVVVAVLAILAVLAVAAIGNIRLDARRASLKYDANALVSAANAYNGAVNGTDNDNAYATCERITLGDSTRMKLLSDFINPKGSGVFVFTAPDGFGDGRPFTQTVSMSKENAVYLTGGLAAQAGHIDGVTLLNYYGMRKIKTWKVDEVNINKFTFPEPKK